VGKHDKKKPKTAVAVIGDKQPRVAASTVSQSPHGKPAWRLRRLDNDGPWPWHPMERGDFDRVLKKIQQFESMTWSEILGADHHEISLDRLCEEAQTRLSDLKLDDSDSVLSLRVTGAERLVGIRLDGVVLLLWWDPKHEVCPSKKK
jgi:hypothetical protein